MDMNEESKQVIADIADAVATIRGLTASLVEAREREDVFAVLLALTVQGSTLRDMASGLYVVLADAGEGE